MKREFGGRTYCIIVEESWVCTGHYPSPSPSHPSPSPSSSQGCLARRVAWPGPCIASVLQCLHHPHSVDGQPEPCLPKTPNRTPPSSSSSSWHGNWTRPAALLGSAPSTRPRCAQ
eukprot:3752236-Pyramimonas_sp.AAC.1